MVAPIIATMSCGYVIVMRAGHKIGYIKENREIDNNLSLYNFFVIVYYYIGIDILGNIFL